jgi:ribulose 1,5-bisphosphate synthetase/thiazole synthase
LKRPDVIVVGAGHNGLTAGAYLARDGMDVLVLEASEMVGGMTATAKPYFARVKEACQLRPSGVPRVSDEELAGVLRSSRAYLITAIGVIGILAILYLMIFKPKL